MPSVETFDCIDDAVLWEADATLRDNFGQVKVASPVEIKVRWNTTKTDGQDSQGNKVTYVATIAAKQRIRLNSIMFHGLIADVTDPPTELVQVSRKAECFDIKGRTPRYEYSAVKYMDDLPTIVPGTGS